MRWLFFLLLLVNVALAGYGYIQYTRPNPDAKIIDFQMNADKIRIVPEPVVSAAQRAARQRTACLEWGNFGDLELRRVSEALASMDLGERVTSRKREVTTNWWVYMPPQGSRARMCLSQRTQGQGDSHRRNWTARAANDANDPGYSRAEPSGVYATGRIGEALSRQRYARHGVLSAFQAPATASSVSLMSKAAEISARV
jgi:hypothetical protein